MVVLGGTNSCKELFLKNWHVLLTITTLSASSRKPRKEKKQTGPFKETLVGQMVAQEISKLNLMNWLTWVK